MKYHEPMSRFATGTILPRLPYPEIWVVDFEFVAHGGNRPEAICMVAKELRHQRMLRVWRDELLTLEQAPFDTGASSLFVAYFASAELGCFDALGWKHPERILDLFTEFRAQTNGTQTIAGNSLLGALQHYGFGAMSVVEKADMRDLILRGGPWTDNERRDILAYCESDVVATERLLTAMESDVAESYQRLGWALLRGRYMSAVARMETAGIPIDTEMLVKFRANWKSIKAQLIDEIDAEFGVFDDTTFKKVRFEEYLAVNGIAWPRLESGELALDHNTFSRQAKLYPKLQPLHQLRQMLGQLRLNELQVGDDGRNRTLLSPFRSKTGRNQPASSKFIFGASAWLRGLIRPQPGFGLAYLDWKSQEIAIAAALSGDPNLWAAYSTGDPYMSFAIQAGLAPEGATRQTHENVRNQCKAVMLGVQYGMSAESIARDIGIHVVHARELLQRHKETFRVFWKWAQCNQHAALCGQTLYSQFGWPIHIGNGSELNERTFLNFPAQSNGGEMMRIACMMATEAGLKLCAPIHDALLLESPVDNLDTEIEQLKSIMQEASVLVLGEGFVCGVDVEKVVYPDRYEDKRGTVMWERVTRLCDREEAKKTKSE